MKRWVVRTGLLVAVGILAGVLVLEISVSSVDSLLAATKAVFVEKAANAPLDCAIYSCIPQSDPAWAVDIGTLLFRMSH